MSTVQFIQTTPEQLVNLITEGVKLQLLELKKLSCPEIGLHIKCKL
jgi:hypothetical protein